MIQPRKMKLIRVLDNKLAKTTEQILLSTVFDSTVSTVWFLLFLIKGFLI